MKIVFRSTRNNFLISFLFLILFFGAVAGCTCKKNIPKENLHSLDQLKSLEADTVYIVYNEENFKKLDFKQKAHPQVDSIQRINFYLKREEGQAETFWQYMEKDIEFTNDSVFITPNNNHYKIKKELIKNNQVISPSLLISMNNKEIFFLLEEKHVVFLGNKSKCEYSAYVVGFGDLFFRPE